MRVHAHEFVRVHVLTCVIVLILPAAAYQDGHHQPQVLLGQQLVGLCPQRHGRPRVGSALQRYSSLYPARAVCFALLSVHRVRLFAAAVGAAVMYRDALMQCS